MSKPNSQTHIITTGAREHNLKDITVALPKNQLIVVTGLSGSGKSSFAFDTLYAEGQRRYVESLSAYARQFLGMMHKPDVDQIEGLSPAISIDQKTTSHNPRSTVGTITEIYDYLRLLYARVGHPHCPNCGREVSTQTVDQISNQILSEISHRATGEPVRLMILGPVVRDRKGEFQGLLDSLYKQGYSRAKIDSEYYDLSHELNLIKTNKHSISVVIDRITISKKQLDDSQEKTTFISRLNQTLETALKLADGFVIASFITDASLNFPESPEETEELLFSEKLACSHCGISITELEPRLFSFNSPHGACPECTGLGTLLKIDINRIIAPELTLSEGAIIPFARMLSHDTWWARLVKTLVEKQGYNFRTTSYENMDEETQQALLYGSSEVLTVVGTNRFGKETEIQETFEGFVKNLERRYQETDSDFIRKEIGQFMQKEVCAACNGTRLCEEALAVHIDGKTIAQITKQPIDAALKWITTLRDSKVLSKQESIISDSITKEIAIRLKFLSSVGLDYLTLDRESGTLAGGEAQRIRLASQIGTGLTGVLYILDEPTIGLHQRDNHRLIETLKNLRDLGNTVIVVEHDRDIMLAADHLVDFGPRAGKHGGEIIAQGSPSEVIAQPHSLTGKYLSRKKDVKRVTADSPKLVSDDQVTAKAHIRVTGARHHNLQTIDVEFPLNTLTCITGISGSGKSTLLHDTLYYHLATHFGKQHHHKAGEIDSIMVPDKAKKVILIDQSPIGKTPRSNPATYTKIFDYVRKLFANTQEARVRGYKAGRFSFNVKGGRCEACQGDGQLKIEMQFLPDVYVTCDVCDGRRYNQETLQVTYKSKSISDVLKLTIDDAYDFFVGHTTLRQKIKTLQQVGLGYIELGQPAPTLSGGEAQRVKLAKELAGNTYQHVIYLLDEPTTGLHFEDVQNLLSVLNQLVEQDNTVIVIEHNLDVIKNADWIIDLGPEGGGNGGQIVATGTPLQIAADVMSYTGMYLKEEFAAQHTV